MGKEKYAGNPLLYIYQPDSEEIHVTMQHHYRSSKDQKIEEKKIEAVSEESIRSEEKAAVFKQQSETSDLEDKDFRDMTIEEQLSYLKNRPGYAPELTCEFKTDEESYQGNFINEKDGIVTILNDYIRVEFEKEKIKEILILGF